MVAVKKLLLLGIVFITLSISVAAFSPHQYDFTTNPFNVTKGASLNASPVNTVVSGSIRSEIGTNLIAIGTLDQNDSYVGNETVSKALFTDSTDEGISLNNSYWYPLNAYTITFWVRTTNPTADSKAKVIFGTSDGSNEYMFGFRYDTDAHLWIQFLSAANTQCEWQNLGTVVDSGNWIPITLQQMTAPIRNCSSIDLWVNGTQYNATVFGDQAMNTNTLTAKDIGLGGVQYGTIASSNFGAEHFAGYDEVLIFNGSNKKVWETGYFLNHTEIRYLHNGSQIPTSGGAAPPVGPTPFTITATDQYDGTTLYNLSTTFNGTYYSTSNGTLYVNLNQDPAIHHTFNLSGNDSGGYFNKTYTNYNTSTDLAATLFQSVLNLNAQEIFTNDNISLGGNFTIGSYQITQGDPLYLTAGTYDIIFSHPSYYNRTLSFTIAALDNNSENFTGIYDAILNVTAINKQTSAAINTFSVTVFSGSYSLINSTTTANITFGLKKDLVYNVSINALGYELKSALVNVNETYNNYQFSLYTANSLRINIRDEVTNILITQNITITFTTNVSESIYNTSNGTIYIDNLNASEYLITFNASGYSVRTYTITVGNRSSQSLTAYLAAGTSTTLFTITDKDASDALENVLSTMYRLINGSWKPIESKYTDITGKVQFSYLPNTNYKFFLSKSGYDDYVFYLNPILFSTYSIYMTQSSLVDYSQDFDKLSIIYAPGYFQYGNTTTFNWIIASPYGELINYGFTLTYLGGSSSASGVNAIGEQLSTSVTIENGTIFSTVRLDYYYETTTAGRRNFTFFLPIIFPTKGNHTFLDNRDEQYGLGVFERSFISTSIVVGVVGIASLVGQPLMGLVIGLFIYGYLAYIGFIEIWLILITMLIGIIYIMWKSGG